MEKEVKIAVSKKSLEKQLLGVPYQFLAMPRSYQVVMFADLFEANCMRIIQEAYWQIFRIFIPPEMLLLPYSFNELGNEIGLSQILLKKSSKEQSTDKQPTSDLQFGDIIFARRIKESEKISAKFSEELRKHLIFYVGKPNTEIFLKNFGTAEDLLKLGITVYPDKEYVFHGSYKTGFSTLESLEEIEKKYVIEKVRRIL